jgi:hypothetical protein
LLDWNFFSVASISQVSLQAENWRFDEYLLGKSILFKIGPKIYRSLLEDKAVLQFTQRHVAINALSSREVESDC